jgi:hypothetical protein
MEHAGNSSLNIEALVPFVSTAGALGAHPNAAASQPDNLVAFPDNDEAINRVVARFQDSLPEWKYRSIGLASLVRGVRDWARDLWARLVPGEWHGTPIEQRPVIFRFEWETPRVLGHYQPGRNDIGFRWEISINPRHLIFRSDVEVAETLLHELLHCFDDVAGTVPRSRNNYHSACFRKMANDLGIPCTRYGASLGTRKDSRFAHWAREGGLKGEPAARIEVQDVPLVGPAKRAAWICHCPSGMAVTVYVPRGSELRARCERCGARFERKRTSPTRLREGPVVPPVREVPLPTSV